MEHRNPSCIENLDARTRINTRTPDYVLLLQVLAIPLLASGFGMQGPMRAGGPALCAPRWLRGSQVIRRSSAAPQPHSSTAPQLCMGLPYSMAGVASCILHPASCISPLVASIAPPVTGVVTFGVLHPAPGCAVLDTGCRKVARNATFLHKKRTGSGVYKTLSEHSFCGCRRNTLVVPFSHTTPRWYSLLFWCSQIASTRFIVVAVLV